MNKHDRMHAQMRARNPRATATPFAASCRCVIKLGGSAITVKNQFETLRSDVLQAVCQHIKQLHSHYPDTGFCVVHGAGSFGHFQASKYQVATGGKDHASAIQGFVETRQSVTQLNHAVVTAFVAAGVPAVGLSACGSWFTANRAVKDDSAGIAAVQSILQQGMIPVLHGDCVIDSQLGTTILSGDTIVRRLAEVLQPSYCVFLMDVAGLLSRPPGQPGSQLLPAVQVAKDGSWHIPDTVSTVNKIVSAASDTVGASSIPHSMDHSATAFSTDAGKVALQHNTGRDFSKGGSITNSNEHSCQQFKQGPTSVSAADSKNSGASSSSSSMSPELKVAAHDSTGGIAAKVAEAAAVVLAGCPVVMVQAATESGAAAVLHGPAAFGYPAGRLSKQSSHAIVSQQQQPQRSTCFKEASPTQQQQLHKRDSNGTSTQHASRQQQAVPSAGIAAGTDAAKLINSETAPISAKASALLGGNAGAAVASSTAISVRYGKTATHQQLMATIVYG